MKAILVDGVEVQVIKKKIKNMYLRVKPGGKAVITAPRFIADAEILKFAESKREWLSKAAERLEKKSLPERFYRDGEEYSLFGENFILRLDVAKEKGYFFGGGEMVLGVGENGSIERRKRALETFYREKLSDALPEAIKICQEKTGLYAKEWRIKNMKTRWGSCNVKEKRIWLSLRLAEKPYECLIYVIYHELAHLKVRGHNKDFYDLLDSFCPDRKRIERALKN